MRNTDKTLTPAQISALYKAIQGEPLEGNKDKRWMYALERALNTAEAYHKALAAHVEAADKICSLKKTHPHSAAKAISSAKKALAVSVSVLTQINECE